MISVTFFHELDMLAVLQKVLVNRSYMPEAFGGVVVELVVRSS